MQRIAALLLAGATLGSLFDWTHVATGTTAYTAPYWLGLAWWVPLMFASAALAIGLSHPHLDRRFGHRPPRRSHTALLAGLVGLGAIWAGSGLLPLPHWQRGLVLAPAALALWWTLDRTRVGLALAAATAIVGCAVEILVSRLGYFVYVEPDFININSWLPWVYVAASVAGGNLGRALSR